MNPLLSSLPFTQGPLSWALVLLVLPLLSAMVCLLWGIVAGKRSGAIATALFALGTLLSGWVLWQVWPDASFHGRIEWFRLNFSSEAAPFTAGILLNAHAALMSFVVYLISFLVHLFSLEYLKHEPGLNRYFSFLGLFAFAMLLIVLADNLLIIFMGWELVGLSSYLLIGFWYAKPSAAAASKKAFIVNRVGDLGFLLALLILYSLFGTLDLAELAKLMPESRMQGLDWVLPVDVEGYVGSRSIPASFLTLAGLGLVIGAFGKSAQAPLQVWLPDAMEGPTPVSALLHAATMVAAGVYLLTRVYGLLTPTVLNVLAVGGAITAFMGAYPALFQHDIKKVLAYSTISQLGYMMLALGVGAYSAAFFHLTTHAFFKAGLFLGAGAIIHALHEAAHRIPNAGTFDAQDMRNMGGLRHSLPFTYRVYLICSLSLIGLPLFSGFLSKDIILTYALGWLQLARLEMGYFAYLVPGLAFLTVFMTALYMGRQLLLVFFNKTRLPRFVDEGTAISVQIRENNWKMKLPLVLLAGLSLFLVFSINPFDAKEGWLYPNLPEAVSSLPNSRNDFTAANRFYDIFEASAPWHLPAALWAGGLALLGLLIARIYFGFGYDNGIQYRPSRPSKSLIFRLGQRNWLLDDLYAGSLVKPSLKLSTGVAWLDSRLIDPFLNGLAVAYVAFSHSIAWVDRVIVDGLVSAAARFARAGGWLSRQMVGGRVQTALVWLLLGILAVVFWIIR